MLCGPIMAGCAEEFAAIMMRYYRPVAELGVELEWAEAELVY
jgi:hypothetical protein